jgi:nitrite reductase/ring-hydroxylating ferredoxin subunit
VIADRVAPTPPELAAPASHDAVFRDALAVADLPLGAMRRVTFGDRDILIAHVPKGILATDDRCPHMSAPLSLGALDGCVVDCPLHSGRFDLCDGSVVRMPTTGGLDADGRYHSPWSPPGRDPRPEPTDLKAQARAATRVRRLRYYPVRLRDGRIEVAVPD